MTKWILRLAVVAALASTVLWGWRHFFPGPEQLIRKRLKEIAETASTTGNEGLLAKAARVQRLATFFTPDVEISIDMPGYYTQEIMGADELMRLAAASRSMGHAIRIELFDVTVKVAADRQSAEAHMTGTAKVPGESAPQVQELKTQFERVDGQWLVRRVETVRTLR